MQEIVRPLNTETPQTDIHSTRWEWGKCLSSTYNSTKDFDSLLIHSPQGNLFDVEGAIVGGYKRRTE